MKTKTLFFDENWKETLPNKSHYAVKLTTNGHGKTLKSVIGIKSNRLKANNAKK